MFFSLTFEGSYKASKKAQLVQKCRHFLSEEFKAREYGKGLNGILIGLICANEPKGLEFFKEREPKYYKSKKINFITESIKVNGFLVYDVKLTNYEHDKFVASNDKESLYLLIYKIKNPSMPLNLIPEYFEFNKQLFLKEFHEMLDSMKSFIT